MSARTVYRMIDAARPPTPKVGVVASVGVGTVDVRFSTGTVTPGLQYQTSYVPAVGDRVLVVPADTAWVVLGKVTAEAAAVPDMEVAVAPTRQWTKARAATMEWVPPGTWYYQYEGAADPYPSTYAQGRFPEPSGGAGWIPRYADWCTLSHYADLMSRVPSGSTINGMSLLLTRTTGGQTGSPLVPPVLYGHAHDVANPPVQASPPTFVAGYGPLVYPGVQTGEQTRVVLSSSFVTGLLSGAIKGFGFWSERADQGAPYWTAPAKADLILSYTPPLEG